jgi:predicted RNA binding protein YcfA (HicA-like mRNA interferase family)
MNKIPDLPFDRIFKALQRDGWVIVRRVEATFAFKNGWKMSC